MSGPTRWGIVAAGKICHDFTSVLNDLPNSEHQVAAIVARDVSRAQKFADEHGIPTVYDTYYQLAEDTHIDVVYVGSIPSTHLGIISILLQSHKNVLCEKPMALNSKEVLQLITLAKQHKVFLMEGMWTRFFPAYQKMIMAIESGQIGDPKMITFNMGTDFITMQDPTSWQMDPNTGGGISQMIGCYALSLGEQVFKDVVQKVVATADLAPEGADLTSSFMINYNDQRRLVATVSYGLNMDNRAFVFGTKGQIELPMPWCPTSVIIGDEQESFPLPTSDAKLIYPNIIGFSYEANHVREMILKGKKESPVMPHTSTLAIRQTSDAIRKEMGLVYPQD